VVVDHTIDSLVIAPPAVMHMANLSFPGAMLFTENDMVFDTECIFTKAEDEDEEGGFRLMSSVQGTKGDLDSRSEGSWTLNARGNFSATKEDKPEKWDTEFGRLPVHYTQKDFYDEMSNACYSFGPTFMLVEEFWMDKENTKAMGKLVLV
jgi:hypothetical protein